jgi:hypothetical protein
MSAFRVVAVLATLALAATAGQLGADEPKPPKPKLVVINIDNLGYADIGAFGSKINRTPFRDAMAKEGRKLTTFYAAPVCSPSRAAPLAKWRFDGADFEVYIPGLLLALDVSAGSGCRRGCVLTWYFAGRSRRCQAEAGNFLAISFRLGVAS